MTQISCHLIAGANTAINSDCTGGSLWAADRGTGGAGMI